MLCIAHIFFLTDYIQLKIMKIQRILMRISFDNRLAFHLIYYRYGIMRKDDVSCRSRESKRLARNFECYETVSNFSKFILVDFCLNLAAAAVAD